MKTLMALLIVCTSIIGCQRTQPPVADRVSDIPLIVDEAMQKRDYTPSTIYYPSGGAVAGPTGYMFEGNSHIPYEATRGTTPFVAAGNFFLLPITLPLSKPWQPREYHGAVVPPTYTAQPPLD